jgi:hypothetical protein
MSSIAKRCPPNFTGADMYALCADAWLQAVKRKVHLLMFSHYLILPCCLYVVDAIIFWVRYQNIKCQAIKLLLFTHFEYLNFIQSYTCKCFENNLQSDRGTNVFCSFLLNLFP